MNIIILPDALEAGTKAVLGIFGNDLHAAAAERVARAAIAAALNAWPGVGHGEVYFEGISHGMEITLPYKEAGDE